MAIKLYRPTTSARRHASVLKNPAISKERPLKSLLISKKSIAGRNHSGKITVRHQGGGSRQHIRLVDFKRDLYDVPARVERLEYDPKRNTRLALLLYRDGQRRYIIASEQMAAGTEVISSAKQAPIRDGNRMPIKFIPTGTPVYDVELSVHGGGKMCRSAGNSATIMAMDGGYAQLKMPSGEIRMLNENCSATIGVASNAEFINIRWGKAGRMRHRGIRPTVRGKVMNPVDHPHGGGEARNSIGLKYPKTYTGKHALGVKTRKRKKYSNRLIVKRRSK